MKRQVTAAIAAALAFGAFADAPKAEILAMMNYETKSEDSLKALKLSGPLQREEGIAVMDVDPASDAFGKILMKILLPADLVAHHIFYNKDMSKGYVSALGKPLLHVMDMNVFPYRLKPIDVTGCVMGEDVIFSEDNSTWYLTCMGSGNVIVGDVASDEVTGVIDIPGTYPHGIAINSAIDRLLVTSTVSGDMSDKGETVSVVEISSGKLLTSHKMSKKESPSGESPVEILFVPGASPPVAYVTNLFGGTLWTMTWNPAKNDFDTAQVFDLADHGAGVALELYFNQAADRLYLSSGSPGAMHIFDISADPAKPKLLKTLAAAEGAHHIAITKDERLAFVQNALLNLPGLSDGSITVVDLQKNEVVGSIDTLKEQGYNPNSIVLLPEWNHLAGH